MRRTAIARESCSGKVTNLRGEYAKKCIFLVHYNTQIASATTFVKRAVALASAAASATRYETSAASPGEPIHQLSELWS